jgi:hypothetical protein
VPERSSSEPGSSFKSAVVVMEPQFDAA